MKTTNARRSLLLVICGLLLASALAGCVWEKEDKGRLSYGVDPMASPLINSSAYRDTIGELTYYDGMTPMRVRGYGLVVGLGTNGSSDCPDTVRKKLIRGLYKQHDFSSPIVGTTTVTPEQMIADPDTAVVIVEGDIPPAAIEGSRFDVQVRAYPGTSTKSLRGGRLYTTDLLNFRMLNSRASMTGSVLAKAAGPVFLNPFSDERAATKVSPLEGTIMGGGMAVEDRRVRLVLVEPSYGFAKRIQDRINFHYSRDRRVADAISPSFIRINVPRKYRNNAAHFLTIVRALYVANDPTMAATRSRLLAQEIFKPEAPHAMISLCFEALGRTALPELNRLYARPEKYVSFYSAAAGLRLEDHVAVDAMAIHADDSESPYRFRAIRALGLARSMANAAFPLRRLLDDPDPRVRIAAYEALSGRNDTAITTDRIADDNFLLDIVPSKGPALVYAKRKGRRRIALFGEQLACVPPLFYRSSGAGITVLADEGDEKLGLIRVSPRGTVSPRITGQLELAKLVELLGRDAEVMGDEVVGLGLGYGAIVRMLYNLCKDKCINAEFVLEQPNALELFGPTKRMGRPESEL